MFLESFDFSKYDEDSDIKTEMVNRLRKVIGPFFLRRIKSDIPTSIPIKREYLLYCDSTEYQNELYNMLMKKDDFINIIHKNKLEISSNILRNLVMDLRKCVNHPYLIHEKKGYVKDEFINDCGKFKLLSLLLKLLKENNHKVLIFSQMTMVLDWIEDLLEYYNYQYLRLDGNVASNKRQTLIDLYNNEDKYFVFLISTRAGGIGINLSSADTVIIYDNDWNPQEDIQAIDRCHRYGQTKPVVVYRLLTRNSIDNRMYNVAQKKKNLAQIIIGKDNRETLMSLVIQENIDDSKSISDKDLEILVNYHNKTELPPKMDGYIFVENTEDNMLGTIDES